MLTVSFTGCLIRNFTPSWQDGHLLLAGLLAHQQAIACPGAPRRRGSTLISYQAFDRLAEALVQAQEGGWQVQLSGHLIQSSSGMGVPAHPGLLLLVRHLQRLVAPHQRAPAPPAGPRRPARVRTASLGGEVRACLGGIRN